MVRKNIYKEIIMTIEQKIEKERANVELMLLKKVKKQIKDNVTPSEVLHTIHAFTSIKHIPRHK